MNAPAVSRCHEPPRLADQLVEGRRHDRTSALGPRNTSATSRSFQTHRNWKIANAPSAGTDNGRTMRMNAWKCDAPSMAADSNRSRGSWEMKL